MGAETKQLQAHVSISVHQRFLTKPFALRLGSYGCQTSPRWVLTVWANNAEQPEPRASSSEVSRSALSAHSGPNLKRPAHPPHGRRRSEKLPVTLKLPGARVLGCISMMLLVKVLRVSALLLLLLHFRPARRHRRREPGGQRLKARQLHQGH